MRRRRPIRSASRRITNLFFFPFARQQPLLKVFLAAAVIWERKKRRRRLWGIISYNVNIHWSETLSKWRSQILLLIYMLIKVLSVTPHFPEAVELKCKLPCLSLFMGSSESRAAGSFRIPHATIYSRGSFSIRNYYIKSVFPQESIIQSHFTPIGLL